jgi:hypothetical protein
MSVLYLIGGGVVVVAVVTAPRYLRTAFTPPAFQPMVLADNVAEVALTVQSGESMYNPAAVRIKQM